MALIEHILVVEGVKQETPTISTLTLRFKTPRPNFKTGQYFSVKFQNKYKPYSLCSPEQEELIQTCIKKVGECSNWLTQLKKGEEIKTVGPMGVFILKKPIKEDIVFLATGSGISPIYAMIKDALLYTKTDKKIWLFFGNKTVKETPYKEELENLEKIYPNFKFIPVVSRDSFKHQGHIQEHVDNYVDNPNNKEFYLCGVKPMVEAISQDLIRRNIAHNQIHYEKFV